MIVSNLQSKKLKKFEGIPIRLESAFSSPETTENQIFEIKRFHNIRFSSRQHLWK